MALIPKKIRYGGQPLEIGVPGAGFDRRQAVRAWEIAVRLREQAARFRDVSPNRSSNSKHLKRESRRQQRGFQ